MTKIKATEGHSAKSVTEFHWTTLSKKFKLNNIPIYSKTLEYFSTGNNTAVASPALPEHPPWHQKTCRVDTELTDYGNKHDNPVLLKNLALEKIASYNANVSVHMYTDASKNSDNRTSAAFCVPALSIEHSARLTDNISIFAAELTAIKLALLLSSTL